MIVLTYDQPIRAAKWARGCFALTFTIEGYARKNRESIADALHVAKSRNHDLAGSIYIGRALIGNRKISLEQSRRDDAAWEDATVLGQDDLVMIEGRQYTVHFPQQQDKRWYPTLSDPIHFRPVAAEERRHG